jgi:hypothetical protein
MKYDLIAEAYLNQSGGHPMIEVDGEMKHRHNSLGQPIHHTDEGIKNFHRWFSGSSVVDEHGRPKVLYHGTNQDFDEFDANPSLGNLIFMTDDRKHAEVFASASGANVMSVYVNAKKIHPKLVLASDEAQHGLRAYRNGYDAIRVADSFRSDEPRNIAVYSSNQIKSALGNNGNFSTSNKITESIDPIAKAYIQLKEESELPKHLLDSITSSGRYSIHNVSQNRHDKYDITFGIDKPESGAYYNRFTKIRKNDHGFWYDTKYARLQKENEGTDFESQSPVLKPEFSSDIKTDLSKNLIYRGISAEEFESIKNTGKIHSKGEYNFTNQKGLTYFSTSPVSAQYYAHSFAPLHFRATSDKPAYVIGIKNPGTGVKIPDTAEHEVGIPHDVDASEIQEIHRGIPYATKPGSEIYSKEWGDKEFRSIAGSYPTSSLVWERIK